MRVQQDHLQSITSKLDRVRQGERAQGMLCARSISAQDTLNYGRKWEHPFTGIANDQLPARLVFMGAGRVGITSMIRRYTLGLHVEEYRPEQAKVMRHTKNVLLQRLRCHVTVQFWDVEGADTRTALMCAQKSHGVAVVYDITSRASFEVAQRLLDNINPRASSILIANKVDLSDKRKVSYEEGRLLAKIHRVEFLETSARDNYNVDEAFQILVSSVPDEYLKTKEANAATKRWQASCTAVLCAVCSNKLRQHEREEHGRKERYNSN